MLSHSVVSNSLRLHELQSPRLLGPWIFQARILEPRLPFSRGSSPSRKQIPISCVSSSGRQILYHWPPGKYRVRPKTAWKGFPTGSMVKNLPANARDIGLIPDSGRSHTPQSKYVHAPQLFSLWYRDRNYWSPHAPGPVIGSKRSHCNEKPVHYNERVAPAGRN